MQQVFSPSCFLRLSKSAAMNSKNFGLIFPKKVRSSIFIAHSTQRKKSQKREKEVELRGKSNKSNNCCKLDKPAEWNRRIRSATLTFSMKTRSQDNHILKRRSQVDFRTCLLGLQTYFRFCEFDAVA